MAICAFSSGVTAGDPDWRGRGKCDCQQPMSAGGFDRLTNACRHHLKAIGMNRPCSVMSIWQSCPCDIAAKEAKPKRGSRKTTRKPNRSAIRGKTHTFGQSHTLPDCERQRAEWLWQSASTLLKSAKPPNLHAGAAMFHHCHSSVTTGRTACYRRVNLWLVGRVMMWTCVLTAS